MAHVVVSLCLLAACGRIGFEARGHDAAIVIPGDAPADASGTDAAVAACVYDATCGSSGEGTCCNAGSASCALGSAGCDVYVECDLMTNGGCGPGAACCLYDVTNQPACFGPFPPPPC